MEKIETRLVGTVNNTTGQLDFKFLTKLANLMEKHKIETVNVSWKHFKDLKVEKE